MEGLWFNDDSPRRVKLRSATSLVGKEPTKLKRIKACWTMNLDSGGEDQITGLPEWLEAARDFVMRNGETITAGQVIKEVNISMGDANLFRRTPVEAPRSQIDHFVIKQMGSGDDPDTVVTFETRTPFSTDLWNWFGQQSGEEFDAVFLLSGIAPDADEDAGQHYLVMTSPGNDVPEDEEEDEDDEEADASEEEDDEDEETALHETDMEKYEQARRMATSSKFDVPAEPRITEAVIEKAKKNLAIM